MVRAAIGSRNTAIATTTPTNGATPKYAPVRAEPRWRSAVTNSVRLSPYPNAPTVIAPITARPGGSDPPTASPITRFAEPAMRPFIVAICRGSAAETRWVRLLSIAQQAHAPAIVSEPTLSPKRPCDCHDVITPPARIAPSPNPTRRLKPSWNTSHANAAVSTTSRLRSNEAVAAGVARRPITSSNGPSPPPKKIAPPSHGMSLRVRRASRPSGQTKFASVNAIPLPRYRSPASTAGDVPCVSLLANGVAAPKRAAAASASVTPGCLRMGAR